MKDKFVVEYIGARQKAWISGFHYNGSPIFTNQITQALVWTEDLACIFTKEAAEMGEPCYWASPVHVNISLSSL